MISSITAEQLKEEGYRSYRGGFFKRELFDTFVPGNFLGTTEYITTTYIPNGDGRYKIRKAHTIVYAKHLIDKALKGEEV